MAHTPRRLTFVVGTSLLTASLSLGCTSKPRPDDDLHVNPGPEDGGQAQEEPEPDHVNPGPVEEPEQPETEQPEDPDKPDTVHANPGPVEEPEPKHVNTRPKTN